SYLYHVYPMYIYPFPTRRSSDLPDINTVTLTSTIAWSEGGVFLDLPGLAGQRIGTYLMNEIVRWVQQWPSATVASIKLDAGQARSEEHTSELQSRENLVCRLLLE